VHPPNRRRPQHPANRRRPRPSPAQSAARRHARWLVQQLRHAGDWLRGLPRRVRRAADTAVSGRILRPWNAEPPPEGPEIVVDEPRPAAPGRFVPRAAAIGRQIAPRAAALRRQLGPQAAAIGRTLAPLALRGVAATSRGLRSAGRRLADPRLRWLLGRFFAAIGAATVGLLGGLVRGVTALSETVAEGLVRHRAVLFGLLTRALWWGALALLLLGGRALVEIHGHAPIDQEALPAFAVGLGVCALLVLVAAQARLRWAALVLGFGHGGLLALAWVVTAAL
jgi:hypothetical protein